MSFAPCTMKTSGQKNRGYIGIMHIQKLPSLAQPETQRGISRKARYALDSLLAIGSIFLLTCFTYQFQLDLKIPNSFLVYLLLVLALAALRGLYASLLAALLAF